jgi:hypothetical protein
MKGDHFLFRVLARKMALCAQGQSSFEEMTCSPAHSGKTHNVHLAINEKILLSTNGKWKKRVEKDPASIFIMSPHELAKS